MSSKYRLRAAIPTFEEWLSSLQLKPTHLFLGFYSRPNISLEVLDFSGYGIRVWVIRVLGT
jgi:hypothetical protein